MGEIYRGLSYYTNTNARMAQRPGVFICCHPADYKEYVPLIGKQILEILPDIVVWYLEDKECDYLDVYRDMFLDDLKTMSLFVIPVTRRFLEEDNYGRCVELPLAIKCRIPILPIIQEEGLFNKFNEVCNNLHSISPFKSGALEIPYQEKLRKRIEDAIVSNELFDKISREFTGRIFLSYRKKDRTFTAKLMKSIHKIPQFRDYAIWYDEFLTPGENYEDNIRDRIMQSDLFLLMITPHILEAGNYVINIEYPFAVESRKEILPVMMQETDTKLLYDVFDGIPMFVRNDHELENAMRNLLKPQKVNVGPEHMYLIGLAYLYGIEVEKDFATGVECLEIAAHKDHVEAIKQLIDIYQKGLQIEPDYEKAIYWREKLIQKLIRENQWLELTSQYTELGDLYKKTGKKEQADKAYSQIVDLSQKFEYEWTSFFQKNDNYKDIGKIQSIVAFMRTEAILHKAQLNNDIKLMREARSIALKSFEETSIDEIKKIMITQIRHINLMIGGWYFEKKDYSTAKKNYLTAREIELDRKDTDLTDSICYRHALLMLYACTIYLNEPDERETYLKEFNHENQRILINTTDRETRKECFDLWNKVVDWNTTNPINSLNNETFLEDIYHLGLGLFSETQDNSFLYLNMVCICNYLYACSLVEKYPITLERTEELYTRGKELYENLTDPEKNENATCCYATLIENTVLGYEQNSVGTEKCFQLELEAFMLWRRLYKNSNQYLKQYIRSIGYITKEYSEFIDYSNDINELFKLVDEREELNHKIEMLSELKATIEKVMDFIGSHGSQVSDDSMYLSNEALNLIVPDLERIIHFREFADSLPEGTNHQGDLTLIDILYAEFLYNNQRYFEAIKHYYMYLHNCVITDDRYWDYHDRFMRSCVHYFNESKSETFLSEWISYCEELLEKSDHKPHMHALVIAYQYQIVHKPLEKEGWKKINALCKRMTVKVLFTRTICYLAMCFQPLRIPLGKLVSGLLEEGWCLVVE